MKVGEVIKLLQSMPEDDDLVIKLKEDSFGRTANCELSKRAVQQGFDWDMGIVFLVPDIPLVRK
jgi:hypothetical protein